MHPDRDPSNPALHTQFVALNEAYRVLSKELSRKEYDTKIRHSYGGGQAFRSTSSYTSPRARWRKNTSCWCWRGSNNAWLSSSHPSNQNRLILLWLYSVHDTFSVLCQGTKTNPVMIGHFFLNLLLFLDNLKIRCHTLEDKRADSLIMSNVRQCGHKAKFTMSL